MDALALRQFTLDGYFLCSFVLSTFIESLLCVRDCVKHYMSQVTFWVRSWAWISMSFTWVPALPIETDLSGHQVYIWYFPASFYLSERWTGSGTSGRERNYSFQIQARWSQSLTSAWLDSFLIPYPFWHSILLFCQILLEIESWGYTELCTADNSGKVSNPFSQIFPYLLSKRFLPAHFSPHLIVSFLPFPIYSLSLTFSPLMLTSFVLS